MKWRVLKGLCILLIVLSCKHTEIIEKSQGNEISAAFEEQKKSTLAKRDIVYSPQWQNSIDFEGATYVPLTTDKRISSFTSDNAKYSLDGNIWLKGKRNSNEWKFSIVTVLPNDVNNHKESGILLSEDWKTGKLSYKGYIGDKLFSPKNYVLKMKSRADINLKAAGSVQCKMLLREVCAGSGREEVCNRWFVRVCEDGEEDANIETPNDEAGDGGGGSPGGGNSGDTNTPTPPIIKDPVKPTEAKIKEQLKDKPFALIPNIPCDIIKKWIATAKFTVDQSTLWRIKDVENVIKPGNDNLYLVNVQNINSAYSSVVNMDYFPITINKMPKINGQVLTPDQFLEYIRKDINKFVDTEYSKFEPYRYSGVDDTNLWNSSNPKNAIVSIDIKGPDNASVIVSNYSKTGWTFTTIYEPMYGEHPVSGNRDFGYVDNGNGSFTFYTRGVDRLTTADAAILGEVSEFFTGKAYPFQQADALWTSFQKITTDFVNKNGGNAGIAQQEIHRPDWSLVKDVIDGKKPLSSLSTDCKN